MQKKVLAIMLGMLTVVSFCGCGKSSGSTYTNMREGVKSKLVTLGDYRNLSYTMEPVSVTDEDVEEEVQAELEWYEDYEEIDRTTAQEGDVVNIDFVGKLDGEEFENGSAEDFDLELGSGDFINGFEEQIIGREKGDSFEVNVTFPDDYSEELGGKDVVFDVTLNKIQKAVPAELTDEFVQENMDCQTVDEYRESVKEDLIASQQEENRSAAIEELLSQIAGNSEFQIDEADIDNAVGELLESYASYAQMYEMELEDFCQSFFGTSVDEFMEDSKVSEEEQLKYDLLMSEIAKKENLGVTQKEYEDALTPELEEYDCESIKEYEEEYGKEDYLYEMLYEKVTQYLLDNSKNEA